MAMARPLERACTTGTPRTAVFSTECVCPLTIASTFSVMACAIWSTSPLQTAVTIAVSKRRGANATHVAEEVLARTEQVKGTLLLASVIAGTLWSAFGASATFMAGAGFALVAAIGLLARRQHAA